MSQRQRSWGIWGRYESLIDSFRGRSPLRKFLDSKERLNWLKIDLNAAEIITVQDFKRTKN